jgi:hypothetical protein
MGGGGAERGILEVARRAVSIGDSIERNNDEIEEEANQVAGKCLWRKIGRNVTASSVGCEERKPQRCRRPTSSSARIFEARTHYWPWQQPSSQFLSEFSSQKLFPSV